MAAAISGDVLRLERSCSLVATALSEGRRQGARLLTGERRCFGMNEARTTIHVPYPAIAPDWTPRALTCGIALQCSPSKDRVARVALRDLPARELRALTIVEAGVALSWIGSRWPGLADDLEQLLPGFEVARDDLEARAMLERAIALAAARGELHCDPLLGQLSSTPPARRDLLRSLRRMYGQMPWSERRRVLSPGSHTIPVGGDGGAQNPNLPPPSRPECEDVEVCPDRRAGVPYPEWSFWSQTFLRDHVAVLERKHASRTHRTRPISADLRRWFEAHTHRAMQTRLEDGADIDIDRYIEHRIDTVTGRASDLRIFKDLRSSGRDVTTALLLDGSASLGARQKGVFQLELACADALCHAMTLARERHGLFLFTGNTRHRVDVTCLKDFEDRYLVVPGDLGLATGGYTRLGAPLRHLTKRLLDQPSERRLLIVIGDGLISDDGYEGRYAWADSAHAVEEAQEAGVAVHYIGVGHARVDPLPDVFGQRRSTRIRSEYELPRILARVHRELAG